MKVIVDKHHPFFTQVILKDKDGNDIGAVKSWDCEKEIAEVYLMTGNRILSMHIPPRSGYEWERGLLYKEVHMSGAYLVFRDTKQRVTREESDDSIIKEFAKRYLETKGHTYAG